MRGSHSTLIRVLIVERKNMKIIRETCVAGKTILRAIRIVNKNSAALGANRRPKSKPSREAVMKVNQKNSERVLTMQLNENFRKGDLHITLTYARIPTPAEAKKEKEKFFRRLKYACQKLGIEFKRIDVTEYENTRIHHHVVISYIDPQIIRKAWGDNGHVLFSVLDDTGNYAKLAAYLIKETSKTFRKSDNPNKRRYYHSSNIITPEIKREEVSGRELHQDPKPIKGYYIDEDSVHRYEHAITKVECIEYIMVSLEEEPRLKRWNKGKKIKPRGVPMSKAEINSQMEMWDENN